MLPSYLRKIAAFSLLLTFSASALHPLGAQAHGPAHAEHHELHLPGTEAYAAYLQETLTRAIREGSGSIPEEQDRLGRELLEAAHAEITAHLAQHPDSLAKNALHYARDLLSALNPIALGRWLIETALRQGPTLAVALGIAELSEQVGVYLALKNPEFAFLLPIYFFHLGEAMVLSLAFGGPHLLRMLARFQSHGGVLEGPGRYYHHLLRQRQALPIDWSEAIVVSRLPPETGAAAAADAPLDFVVIHEGQLERRLPATARVLLGPQRLAQREAFPTVALWELERIVEETGRTPLRKLKKQHPRLYASLLLHEISLSPQLSAHLRASLALRLPSSIGTVAPARGEADVAELFVSAKAPEDWRAAGETPDLVAQRLLWYLRARLHEREKRLQEGAVPATREQLRALRQAERALRDPRGLESVAARDSAWPELHAAHARMREAFEAMDQAIPIACEEAFLD